MNQVNNALPQPGERLFSLDFYRGFTMTYLIAFLLMRKSFRAQLGFTAALLLLTELLYRLWPAAGYNQPFVPDANFGAFVDMLLMGKLSQGHWVAFNAIPTTAHTMWGVLAGQLLMSRRDASDKIKRLLIAAAIGIVLGYALDPLTPIIKRICTSSFVIVSGGWCLAALAFSYWLADVRKVRSIPKFFAIVGMNPLFIYLFAETKGTAWLHHLVIPFTGGLFGWLGELPLQIITAAILWGMLWYMCYFLYRRKVFIKI